MKKFFLIILFIIAGLIFSLPYILSSSFVMNYIVKIVTQKLSAKMNIEQSSFSWLGPQILKGLKYSDSQLDITAETISSNISFFSMLLIAKNQQAAASFITRSNIKNASINFHIPDHPSLTLSNVNAELSTANIDKYQLTIKGIALENNRQGSFSVQIDYDKKAYNLKMNLENIPVIAIDRIASFYMPNLKNNIYQLLGEKLNMTLNADIKNGTGPIDIEMIFTNGKVLAKGALKPHELVLLQPAMIILQLNSNSLFDLDLKSEAPIFLKISDKNFSVPLAPFNIKNLKAGAYLDLGKIWAKNEGSVASMTKLMKTRSEYVNIWFTAVNILVENGILSMDRIDELIDLSFHVCTWGSINLLTKKVSMYLGITADTLQDYFGVENIDSDYVIKVPITGTYDKMQIDASSATARIVALNALQSQGTIGSIIGGIAGHLGKDEDIPPPKLPFPWEGQMKRKAKKPKSPKLPNLFDVVK